MEKPNPKVNEVFRREAVPSRFEGESDIAAFRARAIGAAGDSVFR